MSKENLADVVKKMTDGWGADIVFEASGNEKAAASVFEVLAPSGCVVYIGMPGNPIAYDVVAAQVKEARVEHIFRCAHVYPKALSLMGGGRLDVKSLITDKYSFSDSVKDLSSPPMPPTSVKVQIELPGEVEATGYYEASNLPRPCTPWCAMVA
jgi:D-xylulose reductase